MVKVRKNNGLRLIVVVVELISVLYALFFHGIEKTYLVVWSFCLFCVVLFINKTKIICKDVLSNKIYLKTVAFSLLFAAFCTLGNFPEVYEILDTRYENISFSGFICCSMIGYTIMWFELLYFIKNVFDLILNLKKEMDKIAPCEPCSAKIFFLKSLLMGIVAYMPFYLAFFPGIINSDAFWQLDQAVGNLPYSNHHPWLHTLYLKLFYKIGNIFSKNSNAGAAMCTLATMILLCVIWSYVLTVLYKRNVKLIVIGILWFFFFLIPFNSIYSVTMWKDVPFAALTLLFMVFIWDNSSKQMARSSMILFVLFSFLFCLFRSNGLFAYIIWSAVLLVGYRSEIKKYIIGIIISLLLVCLFKGPIMKMYNVQPTEFTEALSIPLQQIACTITGNGNISDEELGELNQVMDVDDMRDIYYPTVSDPVKINIRQHEGDKIISKNIGKAIRTYLQIGVQNPYFYLKAWVVQTRGYWYRIPINVSGDRYKLYDTGVEKNDLGVIQKSYISSTLSDSIYDYCDSFSRMYENIWSHAWSLWVILIALYYSIVSEKKTLAYCIPIAVWLTVLISVPVDNELRYAYPIFICAPVMLIMSLLPKENE